MPQRSSFRIDPLDPRQCLFERRFVSEVRSTRSISRQRFVSRSGPFTGQLLSFPFQGRSSIRFVLVFSPKAGLKAGVIESTIRRRALSSYGFYHGCERRFILSPTMAVGWDSLQECESAMFGRIASLRSSQERKVMNPNPKTFPSHGMANQALQTTSVTHGVFGKVSVSDRQRRGV